MRRSSSSSSSSSLMSRWVAWRRVPWYEEAVTTATATTMRATPRSTRIGETPKTMTMDRRSLSSSSWSSSSLDHHHRRRRRGRQSNDNQQNYHHQDDSMTRRYFSSVMNSGGSSSSSNGNDRDEEMGLPSTTSPSSLDGAATSTASSSHSNSNNYSQNKYSTSRTPSPHQALVLLEEEHQQQENSASSFIMSLEEQRWLLQIVTSSGNLRLLEKATRQFDWWTEYPESLELLVTGWARTQTATTSPSGSSGSSLPSSHPAVTGAVVAARLLKEWGQRYVEQQQQQQQVSNGNGSSSSSSSPSPLPLLPPPPLSAFRAVLTALAKEGKYEAAGNVLQQLIDETKNDTVNGNYDSDADADADAAQPDRDCFHRVLQACCQAGALEDALRWWERMKELSKKHDDDDDDHRRYPNLQPNASTYKIILQTFVNQHELHGTKGAGLAAYQFLQHEIIGNHQNKDSADGKDAAADHVCYNITLNALAQEGNYELAQDLFLELLQLQERQRQQEELLGNDGTMIDGTGGGGGAKAYSNAAATIQGAGSLMDPIPLRTVLKACAKANTVEAAERAQDFLRTLQQHATPCLDARAYTTVVAIWCQVGYPERAKQVLEELLTIYLESSIVTNPSTGKSTLDPRLQPDPTSFRTVIGAMSQKIGRLTNNMSSSSNASSMEEALELAEEAQQVLMDMYNTMGYTPNLITCNAVLKCWSLARQPEAAEDFLQQMTAEHWNIPPDIVSYNTIIACHAKLGNVSDCTNWLSRLASSSYSLASSTSATASTSTSMAPSLPTPNTRTVTAVITALSKQGTTASAEQAEAWFLQMQDWHADLGWDCAPNQVTLNALLTCWARVGNGARAEYILRQYQHYYYDTAVAISAAGPQGQQDAATSTRRGGGDDGENYSMNGDSTAGHPLHHDYAPNIVSYNAVLQAYGGTSLKKVESLLEEFIAVGLQPNDRTVQTVRRALERASSSSSNPAEKERIWESWKQRFFYFTSSSRNGGGGGSKARRNSHEKQSKQQKKQQQQRQQ